MTQKDLVWVALAVIVSSVTTYAVSNYIRESKNTPLVTLPEVEEIEVKGDRFGVVTSIEAPFIEIDLQPVLGQESETLKLDTTTMTLLVVGPASPTSLTPGYSSELPATLSQFAVGDPVYVRYSAENNREIVNILKSVPVYSAP